MTQVLFCGNATEKKCCLKRDVFPVWKQFPKYFADVTKFDMAVSVVASVS